MVLKRFYEILPSVLAVRLVMPISCYAFYNTFLLMLQTKLITTGGRVYPSERYVPSSGWRCLVFVSLNEVKEIVCAHLI